MKIEDLYNSAIQFRSVITKSLSKFENSEYRVITLSETYSKLKKLSLKQEELFRESMKCIEYGLYRPAYVLSWAAFIDFIGEKLGEDSYKKINSLKSWSVTNTIELRELASDGQILELSHQIGLINKPTLKVLKGLLAKRNENGHPSDYKPGINDSLGYVDDLLKRIAALQSVKLP